MSKPDTTKDNIDEFRKILRSVGEDAFYSAEVVDEYNDYLEYDFEQQIAQIKKIVLREITGLVGEQETNNYKIGNVAINRNLLRTQIIKEAKERYE